MKSGSSLGYGRVLRIGDRDVFGPEVNAASKLGEDTAKAWEILITDAVKKKAEGMRGVTFEALESAPPGADGAFKLLYAL